MAGRRVGIVGSGDVAQSLGSGFLRHGDTVMLGTRDPRKLDSWIEREGHGATVGTMEEAARFGDPVVIAVKGSAAKAAVEAAGVANLRGKTVVDVTNPILDEPPVHGVLRYFTGPNESLMERLQNLAPEAHFVKAWSCIGSSSMVDPEFPDAKPTMFICGNEEGAKRVVSGILEEFGFDVADMGAVEAARAIEPLAMLWCIPGLTRDRWSHAFRLLEAPGR